VAQHVDHPAVGDTDEEPSQGVQIFNPRLPGRWVVALVWVGWKYNGRDRVRGYRRLAGHYARMLPGLTITDVRVWPYVKEDCYVLECNGTCPSVNDCNQRYINISRFKDGKLILLREF
jgi:hypothetical protein